MKLASYLDLSHFGVVEAGIIIGSVVGLIGLALLIAVIRSMRRQSRNERAAAGPTRRGRRPTGPAMRSRPVRHDPPVVVVVDREPVTQIIPRITDDASATAVLPRIRDGRRG